MTKTGKKNTKFKGLGLGISDFVFLSYIQSFVNVGSVYACTFKLLLFSFLNLTACSVLNIPSESQSVYTKTISKNAFKAYKKCVLTYYTVAKHFNL